eukprot:2809551-Pyramimonas_sp.AAC.1
MREASRISSGGCSGKLRALIRALFWPPRLLTPTERFGLQGLPLHSVKDLPSESLALKTSGNAYPAPMVIAAIAPLLKKARELHGDSNAPQIRRPTI